MHLLHLEKLGPFPTSEFVVVLKYFGVFSIFDVLVHWVYVKFPSLSSSIASIATYSFGEHDFFSTAYRFISLGQSQYTTVDIN